MPVLHTPTIFLPSALLPTKGLIKQPLRETEVQMDIEQLVTENIKLVYFVFNTKMFKDEFVRNNQDDIISEGMLGLLRAAKGFNPEKGVKFSVYAVKSIYTSMLLYLRRARWKDREISLDTPISTTEEGTLTLADIIPDHNKVEDYIEAIDLRERIERFYPKLNTTQRQVIKLKAKGLGIKEIAGEMGETQSYVNGALRTAKTKIKRLAEGK